MGLGQTVDFGEGVRAPQEQSGDAPMIPKRTGAVLRALVIVLCNVALLQQDCLASMPLSQAAASAPSQPS